METTPVLSATLVMDETVRAQLRAGSSAIQIAESYHLDPSDEGSPEIAALANAELESIRARAKKLEETRVSFVAPARQIIENAQNLFVPAIEGLKKAEGIIKDRLLNWQNGRRAIADESRRKAEAEARRIREEGEAKAAAERAKAAEREREAQQRAAAAEAERKKKAEEAEAARKAGDTKAAAKAEAEARAAAGERARQEENERKAREEADRKARETQLAAAAAADVARDSVVVTETKNLVGSRANWIAELPEGKTEDDALLAIALAIAGVEKPAAGARTELITLLKLDMSAVKKLAGAQQALCRIPGMTVRNEPIATAQRRGRG